SRARYFLEKAGSTSAEQRMEFEAFLEPAIVFGRTTVHRFKTAHSKHPAWKAWWDSLLTDSTVAFFRVERDWILTEGPMKIGQKLGMPSIGPGGQHIPAPSVMNASELYYFEDPSIRATDTVEEHLDKLERLLENAEMMFV